MAALIEVVDVVKHYGRVEAVRGVSFGVESGQCVALLGPNGAGKTTTVELMEGILRPTTGEVLYRGQPLGPRFREEAGIQFQATALQDHLTVRETLRLFHQLYRRALPLEELIGLCALEDLLARDNRRLSGGQRQRLLLALALVNDPEIVFLDEPTTGLDPQARRRFWDLIAGVKARGRTVLLTTHYMDEAYSLADRIVIMDHGRIIAEGSPQELLAAHFGDSVLVLPRGSLPARDPDLPFEVLETEHATELSTPDLNRALRWLVERGVDLKGLTVRERTLEDLFLELTGRELRA